MTIASLNHSASTPVLEQPVDQPVEPPVLKGHGFSRAAQVEKSALASDGRFPSDGMSTPQQVPPPEPIRIPWTERVLTLLEGRF